MGYLPSVHEATQYCKEKERWRIRKKGGKKKRKGGEEEEEEVKGIVLPIKLIYHISRLSGKSCVIISGHARKPSYKIQHFFIIKFLKN